MRNIIFVALITLFCLSCDKEEITERPMSQTDIWNCYNDSEWSDVKIKNALIGKWKWTYTESYWAPENGMNTESENTVIEFFNDSSLQIIENGELTNTAKWTVKPKDGELFGLELDSTITTLLYGRILICGVTLECNNSYIDGSDNYFIKID
ncbi:hypothetical protein [Lentimicrobium sp. S6]|uniref:hypothetical protein n=1 Tax=Lentimicrobium sp. S6 TaxID=2735872 RepID=UPI0015527CB2|nr:hypothetical protein [Lentimicrobium sp. S6]NPD48210.1 hypothetical protein [Lentimicrobium sp. S6]